MAHAPDTARGVADGRAKRPAERCVDDRRPRTLDPSLQACALRARATCRQSRVRLALHALLPALAGARNTRYVWRRRAACTPCLVHARTSAHAGAAHRRSCRTRTRLQPFARWRALGKRQRLRGGSIAGVFQRAGVLHHDQDQVCWSMGFSFLAAGLPERAPAREGLR
jgi:hypothetical protein